MEEEVKERIIPSLRQEQNRVFGGGVRDCWRMWLRRLKRMTTGAASAVRKRESDDSARLGRRTEVGESVPVSETERH
ncbi:hypothetical protein TIFTF001_021140 [Ficus carica]|uniref:Uncharacterized protein n=1 Tax=Ficus carica TaxID=3494 RepID=A0AA88AC27_FICCA|nr:hypothetical protein TIFTF001_021140 [Ficus carica]